MKCIILLIAISFLFSCGNHEARRLEQYKKQWLGREILIPETLRAKVFNRDTLCNNLWTKKYKLLIYVDSTDCAECKLQLYHWYKMIEQNKNYADRLAFIFVVHAHNPKMIEILTQQYRFDHPVFYDKGGQMNKMNHFPNQIELQTFLLDKNNKVLVVGSPLRHPEIWKACLEFINEIEK